MDPFMLSQMQTHFPQAPQPSPPLAIMSPANREYESTRFHLQKVTERKSAVKLEDLINENLNLKQVTHTPTKPIPATAMPHSSSMELHNPAGLHHLTRPPSESPSAFPISSSSTPLFVHTGYPVGLAMGPVPPSMPLWLTCEWTDLPIIYQHVFQAVFNPQTQLVDTERVIRILPGSGLPQHTLGLIWDSVCRTTPGCLTPLELRLALALIALEQRFRATHVQQAATLPSLSATLDMLLVCPGAPVPHIAASDPSPEPPSQEPNMTPINHSVHQDMELRAPPQAAESHQVQDVTVHSLVRGAVLSVPSPPATTSIPAPDPQLDVDDWGDFVSSRQPELIVHHPPVPAPVQKATSHEFSLFDAHVEQPLEVAPDPPPPAASSHQVSPPITWDTAAASPPTPAVSSEVTTESNTKEWSLNPAVNEAHLTEAILSSLSVLSSNPPVPSSQDDFGDFQGTSGDTAMFHADFSQFATASVPAPPPPPSSRTYDVFAELAGESAPQQHHHHPVTKKATTRRDEVSISWHKCVEEVKKKLDEANVIFMQIPSPMICAEVAASRDGAQYVEAVRKIYGIAQRIHTAYQKYDLLSEPMAALLKDIDIAWHNFLAFVPKFNFSSEALQTPCLTLPDSGLMKKCSVCTAPLPIPGSGEETGVDLVEYGPRVYHASCANFWVNCVNLTLPTLLLED